MRRRPTRALLLALVLLAPVAAAGTESDPEVDDHRDQDTPSLDLLSAWLEDDPRGLRFTIKLQGLQGSEKDQLHFLYFRLDGKTYLAGIGTDRDGRAHPYFGPNNLNGNDIEGAETFPDVSLKGIDVRTGSPAYVSAIIPWDAAPGFEPGAILTDIGAGTAVYLRSRGSWSDEDFRSDDKAYSLERALVPGGAEAALPWVVGGATMLVVSAGAFAYYVRERKARGG